MVTLTIDRKTVTVPEGTTILEAARSVHLDIPTLCYLKGVNEIGACRLCMVEVEGYERLVPACDNAVVEGMVVSTHSPRVREARRVNLRLLLSQHDTNCTKCTRSGNCKLQQLSNDYNLLGEHYIQDLNHIPDDFSNPVIRIENRCVKCMRCIQVCEKIQGMGIWDLMGTGSRTTVGVRKTRKLGESDCTFCGQCVTHCPVGALQEHDDTGKVFDALANPKKITVVQMAPAVRAASIASSAKPFCIAVTMSVYSLCFFTFLPPFFSVSETLFFKAFATIADAPVSGTVKQIPFPARYSDMFSRISSSTAFSARSGNRDTTIFLSVSPKPR